MPARIRLHRYELLYAAAVAGCIALGTWLFWPTLELGLFADDFTAVAMMDGRFAAPRGPLDLFDFANGQASDVNALRRLGSVPWWAPADFRVSFLRPLSSALVHLDRALFGRALWAYHAHSIAAWALLVIAASVLYVRLFSRGVAALATLMFAIDHSQHFPVLWLSNRGGIYATLLGVLGLLAHVRFRAEGRLAYAGLSALWLSLALLFGEWALPMFGYVLAYELLGTTDGWRKRAIALLPAAVPGAAFVIARALLGYGARGSDSYIDPAVEPARFVLALVQRIPVLAADMMFNVPAAWWDHGSPWRERILSWSLIGPSTWSRLPGWPLFHCALGLLAFIALFIMLRVCARGMSALERTHVRWLLLGSLFALTPVVGSFLSTRLTLAAYLGFAPLLALTLRQIGRALASAPRISFPRWFALYALAALLVYLQVIAPLRENIQAQGDNFAATTQWVLDAELDPARVAHQRVFLLAAGEFTSTYYFAYIWSYFGRPLPRSFYPLSAAPCAHDVERVADNAIALRTLGGVFLSSALEFMFRERELAARSGQRVELDGMRVEITRAQAGAPQEVRFVFERSVDDPSYVFLVSTLFGMERVVMPKLGQTLRIPRASGPNWLRLRHEREQRRMWPIPAAVSFAPVPGFVDYQPFAAH